MQQEKLHSGIFMIDDQESGSFLKMTSSNQGKFFMIKLIDPGHKRINWQCVSDYPLPDTTIIPTTLVLPIER